MYQYVELTTQRGGYWSDRRLITPEDLGSLTISTDPIYTSTFTIHSETPLTYDQEKVPAYFDTLPKTGDLFFDFDSEQDLKKAEEDCRRCLDYFVDVIGLREEHLRVYFSGSKGFHLLIPFACLGQAPDPNLHSVFRRYARRLARYLCRNQTLDTSIYNARRMFRYPGSIHPKTGKKKQLLHTGRFRDGIHHPDEQPEPLTNPPINIRLRHQLKNEDQFLPCVERALFLGVPAGKRNESVYTISLYLKEKGLDQTSALQRFMASILDYDEKEISKTILSAFKSDNKFGLTESVLDPGEEDELAWNGEAKPEPGLKTFNDVLDDYLKEFFGGQKKAGSYFIPELDQRLKGIDGGEMVILGGGTGVGKSEMAFRIAYCNAEAGIPVAYITLEVSDTSLVARLLHSVGENASSLRGQGRTGEEAVARILDQAQRLRSKDLPLYHRETKSMVDIQDLETLITHTVQSKGVRLVVIDHLDYISSSYKADNEARHLSHCVRTLNLLCQRLNLGMVIVAHLKKQPDQAHRPSLHEFKGSSAIEQEASTALLLWRDVTGSPEKQLITELTIAKSRKDITLGTMKLRFDKQSRTYESIR